MAQAPVRGPGRLVFLHMPRPPVAVRGPCRRTRRPPAGATAARRVGLERRWWSGGRGVHVDTCPTAAERPIVCASPGGGARNGPVMRRSPLGLCLPPYNSSTERTSERANSGAPWRPGEPGPLGPAAGRAVALGGAWALCPALPGR
eukprot:gene13269-biopygen5263